MKEITKEEADRMVKDRIKQMRERVQIPNPMPEGFVEQLYEENKAIRVKDLVDRQCYVGQCRNASVAMWLEDKHKFVYIRRKFSDTFPEMINCLEEDKGFDLFRPVSIAGDEHKEEVELIKRMYKD